MAQKVIFTIVVMLVANGLMFADGNDPKKETANIKKVSGQVVDEITGETLAGVKVYIPGTDKVVYTDFDGEFNIECDLAKKEQISLSMISYNVITYSISDADKQKIKMERQK